MRRRQAVPPRQLEQYRRDGFVVLPDVLSKSELASLRDAYGEAPIQRLLEDNGGGGHVFEVSLLSTRYGAFVEHPLLVAWARAILGENVELQHSKLAVKVPVYAPGAVQWHQDFAYIPHTNFDIFSAFIYLDDTNQSTGSMTMIRGSHTRGSLSHLGADGSFTAECSDPLVLDTSRHVPIEVRAGSVSLHHVCTLHSSGEFTGKGIRRGLVFQYRAADCAQVGGAVFDDTGRLVHGVSSTVVRSVEAVYDMPAMSLPVSRAARREHVFGLHAMSRGRAVTPESALASPRTDPPYDSPRFAKLRRLRNHRPFAR